MEITEVRIKLMEDAGRTTTCVLFDHLRRLLRHPRFEDHRGNEWAVRRHAQPQTIVALPTMRLQKPPACPVLQSMRRASEGGPSDPRRGRPREALRRHRAPDQLALPRNDPGARDPHVSGGTRTLAIARLRFALRGFRRRCDPRAPFLDRRRPVRRSPARDGARSSAARSNAARAARANKRKCNRPRKNLVRRTKPPARSGPLGTIRAKAVSARESCKETGFWGQGEDVACRLSLSRGERSFRFAHRTDSFRKTPRRS